MGVRYANKNWVCNTGMTSASGAISDVSHEDVRLSVLLDIRDRMDRVLRVIECQNALDMPGILRRIEKNTTKKRRAKK